MALVRPSLILQVMLRPQDYSEHAVREVKRSYMHIAQSVVEQLDEERAGEGNVMRLRIRLLKPYWDTADPAACELWDGVMPKWLRNVSRNLSNAMRAYNTVRHPFGIGRIVYEWADFEFDGNALLRVKTQGNGITPELPELAAKARELLCAGAFGPDGVALIRMPSAASHAAQVAAYEEAARQQRSDEADDAPEADEALPEALAEDAVAPEGDAPDAPADDAQVPGEAEDALPEAAEGAPGPGDDAGQEPQPARAPFELDFSVWGIEYADGRVVEFDTRA